MNEATVVDATVLVRPIRFTDHLANMRDFLAQLGYSTRVSRDERWVTMVGGSGEVALHEAAISGSESGESSLMFEVPRAEALAVQFAESGLGQVEIYDEAWGRVLRVRDGDSELSFDERPDDFYGYQVEDEPQPQHGIESMALLYGPPTGSLDRLLSAAGLVRLDEGDDDHWRVWRAPGGGLVARHPARGESPAGAVRLGFRTHEPLTDLAARLTAAGYTDMALSDESGGELSVTDPDGESVIVQAGLKNGPT
jgi:hypothetical protein